MQISQKIPKVVWYSHLFKNFPQFVVIHRKALVYSIKKKWILFWNSLAFSMIQQILEIWSLLPLPFLNPAWTSENYWFMYCWSFTWRILSITMLACEMSTIVQKFEHSLALPFFRIRMKTHLFQSCGHCRVFKICWHREYSSFKHHLPGFDIAQLESHHLHEFYSYCCFLRPTCDHTPRYLALGEWLHHCEYLGH